MCTYFHFIMLLHVLMGMCAVRWVEHLRQKVFVHDCVSVCVCQCVNFEIKFRGQNWAGPHGARICIVEHCGGCHCCGCGCDSARARGNCTRFRAMLIINYTLSRIYGCS